MVIRGGQNNLIILLLKIAVFVLGHLSGGLDIETAISLASKRFNCSRDTVEKAVSKYSD